MFFKCSLALLGIVVSATSIAAPAVEAPLYPGLEIKSNETDESSKPGVMTRDIVGHVAADPQTILAFFKSNKGVKSCAFDETGDNYQCKLLPVGQIVVGTIYVDKARKNGKTEVYYRYFYRR